MKTSLLLFSLFLVSIATAENQNTSLKSQIEAEMILEEDQNSSSLEDSSDDTKSDGFSSNVEKIKVTGSRIKRIDLEGLNPVASFSAEELDSSGYHSIGDFLRDTNVNSFGVSRGTAGSTATGGSYTEVNGESALILINGLRVTKDPELHAFDLNQVPMNAVERIDVLRGGAGAIYGSDAVGGVINFITKKDFSGVQIFGSLTPTLYPLYRGKSLKGEKLDDYLAGSEASAGVVFGESGSNWSYIGNLNARYQENIRMDQRQWSSKIFSGTAQHATFSDIDSGEDFHTNCPDGLNEPCLFDYTPYADFMPRYLQLNGFVQGEYRNNDITYYTQVLGGFKRSQYFYAPIPVNAGVEPPLEVKAGHPISEVSGRAFKLSHRFLKAGRRDTPANYWMLDTTVGLKGYLSKIWDYDFSLKGAHIIKNRTEKNVLLRDKVISAIEQGLYNPLKPTKEGLKEAIHTAKGKSNSSLIFSSLDFSGQQAGFDLATGFQAYFERYSEVSDPQARKNNILSNAGSDGKGNRYVGAYYLEAIKSFADILELQLAWRADYYSDFGLTNFGLNEFIDSDNLKFLDYLIGTPKLAFRFQPDPRFLLRGSIGSSFKAPNLSSLYGGKSSGFPWLFDTPGCVTQITNLTEDSLNKKLQKEISKVEGEEEKKAIRDEFQVYKDNFKKVKENKGLTTLLVAHEKDVLEKGDLSEEQKKVIKEQSLVDAVTSLYGNTESCKVTQYYAETSSNKNLDETRAITASLGSAIELTEDINLSLDLIYIAKNAIPSLGITDSTGVGKKFLNAEALKGKSALEDFGVITKRKEDGGQELENVQTKYLNLADSRKLFVDFNFNLADIKGLSYGKTYWANNFTFFLIDKAEEFPGLGVDDLSGKFRRPRWRNASVLGWQDKKHHVFLKALSAASFQRNSSNPSKYFPLYTRFDVNYEYKMNEKTSLQFNIYNFLNLSLNFKNKSEDLLSFSLDIPFDPDAKTVDTRTVLDIFGINGAYFTVKISHLL